MNLKLRFIAVTCLLLLSSAVAYGSTSHRLAYSKKMGAEVYVTQVDGVWCQEAVEVKVNLESSSSLLNGGLENFLHKVSTVLQKDCGTINNVRFDVYRGDSKALISSYSSSAQKSWAIVKSEPNNKDEKSVPESSQATSSKGDKDSHPASSKVASQELKVASVENVYGSGFEGLFVNYFRFNSDQLDRNDFRWWARDRFKDEYRKVRRQEFKLNSLIEKAKDDFTNTLNKWDENVVTLVAKSSIGKYDFDNGQFELQSSLEGWNLQNPYYYEDSFHRNTVGVFAVEIEGADLLRDVVMKPALAEKFISKRTDKWNRVDRTVYVKINFEIDHSSYSISGNKISVKGRLHSGKVYNSKKLSTEVLSIENSQVETLLAEMKARQEAAAKAEEERIEKERIAAEEMRKEQEKRRFVAQKEAYIASLKSSPLSIRLASYLYEKSLIRPRPLDNLADARASAALNGGPVRVGMLIQMDEGGRQEVETQWPGLLNVNTSEEMPELKSSGWYLVDGFLSVINNGKLEPAVLNATRLQACQEDMCKDLASPELIVERYMKMKFSEGEK